MGRAAALAAGGPLITPGLFRRSLRRALRWRVLLLFWAALIVPGLIAAGPAFAFLRQNLDHSPRASAVVAFMDGATAIELFRDVFADGASHALLAGFVAAVLALLVCAPFVAGAMVTAARSDEPPRLRSLLAGAGDLYGRMLRTALAGLLPLALAGALIAGIVALTSSALERVLTETAADRVLLAAALATALVLFAFHLILDAGRAQFAADASRRSALAALWSGARLCVRNPLRTLALGALGTLLGLGIALAAMAMRLQIPQRGPASMALAWLLAQTAQLAIGWGRAVRIEGLAEVCRADAALRAAAREAGPPAARPATVSVLDPPGSGAAR